MADLKDSKGRWNRELIKKKFLNEDYKAIMSISLSLSPKKDTLTWFYDPNGVHSIKSGYHVATYNKEEYTALASSEEPLWWKTLCNLDLPDKIKLFLWRAIIPHSGCERCQLDSESVKHPLLTCPEAK